MIGIKFKGQQERYKITVMAILLGICCFLAFYVHAVLGIEIIYSHFFYIPIILASLWWRKKGLLVAIFLVLLLLFTHLLHCGFSMVSIDNIVRASFFIIVGVTVGTLSGWMAKAAEEIKREKRFAENIVATIPNSLLVLDSDLRIKNANRSFHETFQTDPEKVTGSSIAEILGDKDGRLSAELTKLFGTEDMLKNFELHCRPENLGKRIFNIMARAMLITEEELVVLQDITVHKQAEEALQKTLNYLKNLINYANAPIIVWDPVFRITLFNHAFEHLTGYTADEVIGRELRILFPEASLDESLSNIEHTLSGKYWESVEIPILCQDGETRIVLCNSANIYAEDGTTLLATIVQGSDITECKQTEEALRKNEKKFEQAIQGNSIPTFIIDNNHTITHWNKACESLTGFSASEVVGTKKQWSAFYAEERPVMADFIVDGATEEEMDEHYKHIDYNKSVLIKGAYEGENFYPGLEEKGRWLCFTAAPLRGQQGKIIGAIETFQDITERRSMEEQLRQSQKMEAIGTLAGGIAHDFNNLLTVVIGNAELALMNVIKDESLRKEIEEIKKCGEKAASLTRQLLAFSRKQIIKPDVLDINEEINETEKMLKRIIGEDIELQMVLEPELWKVYADLVQIDQVIINIVVNAGDAMPQGGKLTIETANADLDESYFREHGIKETPGHYVMLAISDTGSGMDKETREHIFEPFFTTKEVGKGTGLGLSTVYGIVKQSNGFVWVYSELGKGTIFKVYLPEMKGDREPEEKEQTHMDDLGGSETVLIVDDDDGLRKFAQEVLLMHGYRVLDAENGEDAEKVGKEHEGPIHLLLTDVVMPKMSGKEVADRLQPLYPQMKVIYMSGYTDNAIVHHGVLAQGLNFLEKPFTPKGLARKVREVLEIEK